MFYVEPLFCQKDSSDGVIDLLYRDHSFFNGMDNRTVRKFGVGGKEQQIVSCLNGFNGNVRYILTVVECFHIHGVGNDQTLKSEFLAKQVGDDDF